MLSPDPATILHPEEPAETIEGDPARGLLLLCEHASNYVPDDLARLGVPEREFSRHIAYDIGAHGYTLLISGVAHASGRVAT